MAYSEESAHRIRERLEGLPEISEIKMMGGLCFLMSGNMLGATRLEKTGRELFLFRVGKDGMAEALRIDGAEPMVNGTRTMSGFVRVEASECDDAALSNWLSMCVSFVSGLPAKERD